MNKCAGIAPFLLGAIGFYLKDAIVLFSESAIAPLLSQITKGAIAIP